MENRHDPLRDTAGPSGRASGDRANLYDEITGRIIAELEAAACPGCSPGEPGCRRTNRPAEERRNRPALLRDQRADPLGRCRRARLRRPELAHLPPGARAGRQRAQGRARHHRRLRRPLHPGEERQRAQETGKDARAIHFLKRFTVFNVEQCDGLPPELAATAPPADTSLIEPRVQALIATSGADLRIGGERAYYDVLGDFIRVPPPQAYFQPIDWHRTALHELGHWTGHASRLGREIANSFGSKKYAQEELVAEMTAASPAPHLASCRRCATPTTSAPGWRCCARTIARSFVVRASAASKAADFLLSPSSPGRTADDRSDSCSGGSVVTRQSNAHASAHRGGGALRPLHPRALTRERRVLTSPSAAAASPCTSPVAHISAGTTVRPSRRPASLLACRSSTAEGGFEVVCDLAVRGPDGRRRRARQPAPGVPSPTRRSRLSRMPIARPVRSVWNLPAAAPAAARE